MCLEAYTEFQPASQTFTPHVVIGDGCKIGTDSHISSINSVILGNMSVVEENFYYG